MARSAPSINDPELISLLNESLQAGEMSWADSCRYLRAAHGLTQAEFAGKLGVALKVIKEIESGSGNPTLSSLMRIAKFAGMRVGLVSASPSVRFGTQEIMQERHEERLGILRQLKQGKRPRHARNERLGRRFKVGLPKLS